MIQIAPSQKPGQGVAIESILMLGELKHLALARRILTLRRGQPQIRNWRNGDDRAIGDDEFRRLEPDAAEFSSRMPPFRAKSFPHGR